ncbi:MAG: tetratricopeptide repeat protein [bacterium]
MKKAVLRTMFALVAVAVVAVGCAPPEITSAKIYINNQDYVNARASLEKAIQTYPDNAEAYKLLGDVDIIERKWELAAQHYGSAAELSPSYRQQVERILQSQWVSKFNNSVALMNRGDLDQAYSELEICTTLMPERVPGWMNRAAIHGQRGEIDQAMEMYGKVLELEPEHEVARKNMAFLHFNQQHYQETIDYLEPMRQTLLETDPRGVNTLAVSYLQTDQRPKAIELLEQALEHDPDNVENVWNMASLYYQEGQPEKAFPYWIRSTELNPFNAQAFSLVAFQYIQQEELDKALPYLEKAVELDPNDADSWELLGIYWVRKGEPEKGRAYIERAEQIRAALGGEEPPPTAR